MGSAWTTCMILNGTGLWTLSYSHKEISQYSILLPKVIRSLFDTMKCSCISMKHHSILKAIALCRWGTEKSTRNART